MSIPFIIIGSAALAAIILRFAARKTAQAYPTDNR